MEKSKDIVRLLALLVLGLISAISTFTWANKVFHIGSMMPSYFLYILGAIGLVIGALLWNKTKGFKLILILAVANFLSYVIAFLVHHNFL